MAGTSNVADKSEGTGTEIPDFSASKRADYEALFANRYTDSDEAYKKTKTDTKPICLPDWTTANEDRDRQGGPPLRTDFRRGRGRWNSQPYRGGGGRRRDYDYDYRRDRDQRAEGNRKDCGPSDRRPQNHDGGRDDRNQKSEDERRDRSPH